MQGIIDCDTHLIESEALWELIDPELYARRPVLVRLPTDTLYRSCNATWLIDGQIVPKPAGVGGFRLHSPAAAEFEQARTDTRVEARELSDVAARIEDMDRLDTAVQIVYPTVFLAHLTSDPRLEVALCRAHHAWLSNVFKQNDRIRWVYVPPVQSIDIAAAELSEAKKNGCVGVMLHGDENEKSLADPYFFPLYEAAADLDLAICVHSGSSARSSFVHLIPMELSGGRGVLPVLIAFRDIATNQLPEKFPGLRFGFIESGASWVPFVLSTMDRGTKAVLKPTGGSIFSQEQTSAIDHSYLRDNNLFVACFTNEDLPYLVKVAGEDNLIIGSDYGHIDTSFEATLATTLRAREDLPERTIEKILVDNPRRFYGLP